MVEPDQWKLEVKCGIHNHETSLHLDGHSFAGRLNDEEMEYVERATFIGTNPRDILNGVKKLNEDNVSTMRTIYNARQKSRVLKKAGRSQLQFLLGELKSHNYYEWHKSGEDDGQIITDLFFSHPVSVDLLRTFPTVLIMDSTYKVIRYGMPLFEIVGVTCNGLTFCAVFSFMSGEKLNNFKWVLECLKSLISIHGIQEPRVILTDRDLALMNAIEVVFPETTHMLCRWHINQNVQGKTRKHFLEKSDHAKFVTAWKKIAYAASEIEFDHARRDMLLEYKDYPLAIEYTEKSWLDKYMDKFVVWKTNNNLHLVHCTTNRVESAHSNLKRYIRTSKLNFELFWGRVHSLVEIQHAFIRSSFEKSRYIALHKFADKLFDDIRGKVSHMALELFFAEVEKAEDTKMVAIEDGSDVKDTGVCICAIKSTHGIPCYHQVCKWRKGGISASLDAFHIHWTRLEIMPRSFRTTMEILKDDLLKLVTDVMETKDESGIKHIYKKWFEVVYPETSSLLEPLEKQKHRGRPQVKRKLVVDTSSTKRENCGWEYDLAEDEASHDVVMQSLKPTKVKKGKAVGSENTIRADVPKVPRTRTSSIASRASNTVQPSIDRVTELIHDPEGFLRWFPIHFNPFISGINDVKPDGYCGYRALSFGLYGHEEGWRGVRKAIYDELMENYDTYNKIYNGKEDYLKVAESINYYETPASPKYWMTMPEMGIAIATKFECIVHFVSLVGSHNCSHNFLPLRGKPPIMAQRREIRFGFVDTNHFVNLSINPFCPCARIHPTWQKLKSEEATHWELPIVGRCKKYTKLEGRKPVCSFPEVTNLDEFV